MITNTKEMKYKFIITLFVSLFIIANSAKDIGSSPRNKRSISDLMYFPSANTFFINSNIGVNIASQDFIYIIFNYAEVETFNSQVNFIAGYGIIDELYLSISTNYFIYNISEYKYSAGITEKFKENGLTDPLLNVAYRPIEQTEFPFTLDILFKYSPELIPAESSSTSATGNAGKGRQSFGLEIKAGKKISQYELAGYIFYNYFTNGKYKELQNNHNYEIKGGDVLGLGFKFQYPLLRSLKINFGLLFKYYFKSEVKDEATLQKNIDNSHYYAALSAGLKYRLTRDKMMLSFDYSLYGIGDYNVEIGSTVLTSTGYNGHLFSAGILLQI